MSDEVLASADDFDLGPPPADLNAPASGSLPAGETPATGTDDVAALWEQYQQMRAQFDALGKALSERVGPAELPAGKPDTPVGVDVSPGHESADDVAAVPPLDFGPPLPNPSPVPLPETHTADAIPEPVAPLPDFGQPVVAPDSGVPEPAAVDSEPAAVPMPDFAPSSASDAAPLPSFAPVDDTVGNSGAVPMPDFGPAAVPMPNFEPAAPQEPASVPMPDFAPAAQAEPTSVPMPDFAPAAQAEPTSVPMPDFAPVAGPGSVPMPDFGGEIAAGVTSDLPSVAPTEASQPFAPAQDGGAPAAPAFDTPAHEWEAPASTDLPSVGTAPYQPADDPYARLGGSAETDWDNTPYDQPAVGQQFTQPQDQQYTQPHDQQYAYDQSAAIDHGQYVADPGAFMAQDILVMMADHGPDSQATVRQEVAFGKIREGARQSKSSRTKKKTKGKGTPRFLDISTRFIEQIPLVICVTSPKGGVGKSTSAANLAALFAKSAQASGRSDIRVLLVDGDVANGNWALRVAQRLEPNMLDMLIHKDELQQRNMEMDDYKRDIGKWVLAHPDLDNLDILAAPDNPEVLGEIDQRDLKELMAAWARHFQIIVIDSGTQIVEQPNQAWMSFASQVYLMVEPEIACLQVTAEFVKRAQMFKLLTREKCRVVCIRADMDLADLDPQKVISEVFSFVPADRQFFVPDFHRDGIEAANAGEFLVLESADYARHMLPIAKAALEAYERDYGMTA